MAQLLSESQLKERKIRSLANKAHAQDLCVQAMEQANELFDSGDLNPYLLVLSRLHWYNFYNLLLILRQYPSATHLAAFRVWKDRIGDPGKWVLKKEFVGKGIELVAPATSPYPRGTRSLYWDCLRQFDISQTHVQGYEAPRSVYLSGESHIQVLVLALQDILRGEYHMTVLTTGSEFSSGNAGYIEGNMIYCRPDSPGSELLLWLSEGLLSLTHPEKVIGERFLRMFLRMAQHCLFRIWGFEERQLLYLPQDKELICSVPADLRPIFLDLLQRRVRNVEESVYSKYQEHLHKREEEDISDPLQTLRMLEYEKEAADHEDSPSGLE